MNAARLGFGCAVDNYGTRIFAVGGTLGKQQPIDTCEYYDIETDTWYMLPDLNEPKFS
jgi:hypothetical protein